MLRSILRAGFIVPIFLMVGILYGPLAAQEYVVVGAYGSRNAYRNSTTWIQISSGWYSLQDFTVNPSGNTLKIPGNSFKNNALVHVFSSDVLPYPLTRDSVYYVCDVTPDMVRLAYYGTSGCSATARVEFQDAGTGRLSIGQSARFNHVLIDSTLAGLPAGTVSEIWCGTLGRCQTYGSQSTGKVYSYAGASTIYLKLRIPADAPLGPYKLTLKLEPIGSPVEYVDFPIQIHPEVSSGPQASAMYGSHTSLLAPPLPEVHKWESTMRSLAAKWCDASDPAQVMYFGVETQVWFYDGADVYYKIADYLKNPAWQACGTNIARQYRDYVIANKGKVPGWRVFPRGLARAYELTGDSSYRDAVAYLALNGLMAPFGGQVRDDYIRETAFALESMVTYERLTGKRAPKLTTAADLLLGIFDQLFVSDTFTYHQIFMDGLAMRALIDYWDLTRDPRAPLAIKIALDWIWDHAWLPAKKRLMINPELLGPRCFWGCQRPDTGLINLTAPAYAWYWTYSGDWTYLERGDAMFSHALDEDISFSGKIFSQNYTWSFDYVKWRAPKGFFY